MGCSSLAMLIYLHPECLEVKPEPWPPGMREWWTFNFGYPSLEGLTGVEAVKTATIREVPDAGR